MIGLVQMIKAKVLASDDPERTWIPVPRSKVEQSESWAWPLSRYYYRLLDACPLRIPHAQQHGAGG